MHPVHLELLEIGATDTTKFIRQVAEALKLDNNVVETVITQEEDISLLIGSSNEREVGLQKDMVIRVNILSLPKLSIMPFFIHANIWRKKAMK